MSAVSEPFQQRLQQSHLKPLWQIARDINSNEPRSAERAMIWRWTDFQPLIEATVAEVSIEDAVRRVLIMANPAYGGRAATCGGLNACLQILEPGEVAPPHRHSISAIRLITSAAGGVTTVDETGCRMAEGDLILTPGWSWHGHRNDTNHRVAWIDILDVPLVTGLDAVFFEPAPADGPLPMPAGGGRGKAVHHPWRDTHEALDRIAPAADGSRLLRHVDPVTGGAVMPTIDCYALALAGGRATQPRRTTSSGICVVLSGEGRSNIGGETIDWAKNDVFTLPHWQWTTHLAGSADAYLAIVNNHEMLHRLGLLVTETDDGGTRLRSGLGGASVA